MKANYLRQTVMYPKLLNFLYLYLITISILNLATVKSVKAQDISPTQIPVPQSIPKLPELQLPIEETPEINEKIRPIPKINPSIDESITIKDFIFRGNTVIKEEELRKIVTPYIGKSVKFSELNKVIADINKLYIDRGYITSGSFIPGVVDGKPVQFKQEEAIIPIEIVEGKIEEVKITGDKNIKIPISRQIKEAVNPVLNQNRLITSIRLLQNDPKIRRISVELEPGTETGKSILKVEAKASNPISAYAILDNDSNEQVGSLRRGFVFSNINLAGLGDKLELYYLNTDGSNQFNGSYTVPITKNEGTISLSYSFNQNKIIKAPFNALNIKTDDNKIELRFRQPVIRKADSKKIFEVALGTSFSNEQSQTLFLDNVAFPNSGADQFGKTNISALRLFQDFSFRSDIQSFNQRIQLSIGLPLFGATQSQSAPDGSFFSVNLQTEWLRQLPYNLQLTTRAEIQWADRPLVPLEQLNLGGSLSVIGDQSSALRGDSGVSGSVELLKLIYSSKIVDIQVGPFLSGGSVFNNSSNNFNLDFQNSSLNTGISLKVQLWNRLFGRLSWAIPIINSNQDTFLQDNGLSFSVQCKIF